MLDDDTLIRLVKDSFEATPSAAVSPSLERDVRSRLRQRRIASWAVACAAILAVALPVVALQPGSSTPTSVASGGTQTKLLRLSSYTFKVPAQARTTTTCLDNPEAWTGTWNVEPAATTISSYLRVVLPDGSYGTTANGSPCVGAAFTYATSVPAAVHTVTATGEPTVYVAASTAEARVAYIALDPAESALAAQRTGGPVNVTYYIIGQMPLDNDESVIVSLLQQGPVAASLSIHDND